MPAKPLATEASRALDSQSWPSWLAGGAAGGGGSCGARFRDWSSELATAA